MAKAIDLPITGLESDKSWERYKGSRVREYLQKKVGAFYRPDKRQDDDAYHLLGFETDETKADWLKRWQAAVDAGDNAAMSALWTDKLIIQDTFLSGVPESLIKDMEQLDNRIAALESKNLQLNTIVEFYFQGYFQNTDIVEYIPNVSINIKIQLQDANGIISKDANYTNKHLYYTINGNDADEADVQDDNVNVKYKYDSPGPVDIEAWGIATYKEVPIKFPIVHKSFYAVLPSYIGYIEDYNNWNNTGTKLVKYSLNGQYDVTNPYDLAYLVIAIPKNGMVYSISSIIQKGALDAVQQYDVIDKDNYTLYVCRTRHNKGTYTFAVS